MRTVLTIVACGLAVAGCASGSDALKSATPTLTLQFESEPAGAEVKTSNNQTCRTPCALAVPATDLMATFSLNGYKPQTVPVKLMPPDDPRGDGEIGQATKPPRFQPSPVYAELEKATPARKSQPPRRPAPARAAPAGEPAAQQQPAAPAPSSASPWPPAPGSPGQVR